MIQLISKHWTYASTQGAFSKYPIDPAHETPFNISGVITRWFNGKRERVRKEKNPEDAERVKLLRKKSRWRSNLASHRTSSMKSLSGDNSTICAPFEESRCHSDTEDLPSGEQVKLKLPWRSAVFSSLCKLADGKTTERLRQETGRKFSTSQLFETRRRAAIRTEENAMVPMNLPLDCYDDRFLNSLSDQAKRELTNKPACGLLELHFQLTQG
ncbi:hypothetical protein PTTG_29979 [Puccinia triticina 1-1 BBBD Race 1]|uniref:Uncharacterized protein n=1 Tax=Puccinia triticina (isolate 1-1 / race 1 (BBBD)) TaxID=630390 RepID=A0A180G386_PUCT1|nr:hypothetical protein PTTG_29979 [Puccinia triticina 1-1 BBBD Race 1]